MKILAFVDSHANKQAHALLRMRSKTADIVVCAGDISVFGMDLLESLEEFNSWGKPFYFIHGNHEDEELLVNVNEHYPNLHFVHKHEVPVGEVVIWGYGGGGFAKKDPELEKYAKKFSPHPKRIMLFHGPPFGTATDFKNETEGHVGCHSRRKVIEELKPLIVVSGHIHETFNTHEKLGRTFLINPGPLGKLISVGEKTQGPQPVPLKMAPKKKAGKKK